MGALVTYSCKYGYQMANAAGDTTAVQVMIRCDENGNWGPNVVTCSGEYRRHVGQSSPVVVSTGDTLVSRHL